MMTGFHFLGPRSWVARTVAISFGIAIVLSSSGTPGAAQTQKTDVDSQQKAPGKTEMQVRQTQWEVKCATPPGAASAVCEMGKQLLVGRNNQLLSQIVIDLSEDRTYQMRVLVPHGVNLKTGLVLTVDENTPKSVEYTTSVPAGVIARFPLDRNLFDSMKVGSTLKVQAKSRADTDVSVEYSLVGFTSSMEKLR